MSLAVADGFTQLAIHVLAHVRRAGPGDLYDGRHVAWSAAMFSAEAEGRLCEDAGLLAALWREDPRLDVLDALPELHRSLAAFRATAGRALADVEPAEVADPRLLRALQRVGPAAELVHAAMGLLVEEFAAVERGWISPWSEEAIAGVDPWLVGLAGLEPGLADAEVELVWALGPRGRGLPGRLLIGCVDPAGDPVTPAIVALHEHVVCTSGHVDYGPAEWAALVRGARVCGAAPTRLHEAHARWLAGLELGWLLDEAVRAGLVADADAAVMRGEPAARADVLRRL